MLLYGVDNVCFKPSVTSAMVHRCSISAGLERWNSRGLLAASVYIGVGMLHTLIPLSGGQDDLVRFIDLLYMDMQDYAFEPLPELERSFANATVCHPLLFPR
ncbi:hypothetical protein HDV57DRAFT_227216 [Trichoderma longibrachiatum]